MKQLWTIQSLFFLNSLVKNKHSLMRYVKTAKRVVEFLIFMEQSFINVKCHVCTRILLKGYTFL